MTRKCLIIPMTVIMLLITSCGSTGSSSDSTAAYAPAAESYAYDEEMSYKSTGAATIDIKEPMLVKTAYMNMETTDFVNTAEGITDVVEAYGGYTQSADSSMLQNNSGEYRRGSYVLRIPSGVFEDALAEISAMGEVTSSSVSEADVSTEYYDLESRLESKRVEEDRLLELIADAKDLSAILVLESRLSDTRTEITRLEARINSISRQVAYSTLTLTLTETEAPTSAAGFLANINNAFSGSLSFCLKALQNIAIIAVSILPPGLIIAAAALVARTVYKRTRRQL